MARQAPESLGLWACFSEVEALNSSGGVRVKPRWEAFGEAGFWELGPSHARPSCSCSNQIQHSSPAPLATSLVQSHAGPPWRPCPPLFHFPRRHCPPGLQFLQQPLTYGYRWVLTGLAKELFLEAFQTAVDTCTSTFQGLLVQPSPSHLGSRTFCLSPPRSFRCSGLARGMCGSGQKAVE